jgi:hypothetical protein
MTAYFPDCATSPPVLLNKDGEMARDPSPVGSIRADEVYSKQELIRRLGISQKTWDKLLDEGLPYAMVGHSKWVTGRHLIEHLARHVERKRET